MLREEGIAVRVVSMPSIGLFNDQDEAYRLSVLPASMPHYALTAGLPSTMRMIIGFNGRVYGLSRFGASAPFQILDQKFGYTPENICADIKNFIKK